MKALSYTAFEGESVIATGRLEEVAIKIKRRKKPKPSATVLIFSDSTGKQMDLDVSGSEEELFERLRVFVAAEIPGSSSSAPGRPKLGVVAREISLLPRHWEWLATQSGGASAAIRRLVEEARKKPSEKELLRESQERTHKFMTAIAGDFPNYEEALRALYSKDKKGFQSLVRDWPKGIRDYSKKLADPIWERK